MIDPKVPATEGEVSEAQTVNTMETELDAHKRFAREWEARCRMRGVEAEDMRQHAQEWEEVATREKSRADAAEARIVEMERDRERLDGLVEMWSFGEPRLFITPDAWGVSWEAKNAREVEVVAENAREAIDAAIARHREAGNG